jgi:DNA-binding response OmpR family regulator
MMGSSPLVLVVEDEFLIGLEHEASLRAGSWRVLGPASSGIEALDLLAYQTSDIVLLDVQLGHELVTPVAYALRDQGVPFVVCSAFSIPMDPLLASAPNLGKPLDAQLMFRALGQALLRPSRP